MPALPRFVAQAQSGSIRGYNAAIAALADRTEVRDVVSALTFARMDPRAGAGTVRTKKTVRLDRQPNAGSGDSTCANFQVQVNREAGVQAGAGTTIGQLLVPGTLFEFVKAHKASSNLKSQLENVARSALLQSVNSRNGTWYLITVS